jgi:glycosyltransferase involved in cell wall biosynthesis
MSIKISVIIPNYNHSEFLKKRIDSVLNQTFQDFELIILDDKSPDNSIEIIEQYRNHPKVSHIVYNEINSGTTFKQWEKGINLAKNDYIWIAESDDWCEPSLLQTLVDGIAANENIVLAYVQSYYMVGDNKIAWATKENFLESTMKGDEYVKQKLAYFCTIINASMAVFKKSTFANVNQKYTTFKMCGDWLFWSGVASQGNVFISGKTLNYFRNHDKDVSSKVFKSGLNHIEDVKVITQLLDDNLITSLEYQKSIKRSYLNFRSISSKYPAATTKKIDDFILGLDKVKPFKWAVLKHYYHITLKRKILHILRLLRLA